MGGHRDASDIATPATRAMIWACGNEFSAQRNSELQSTGRPDVQIAVGRCRLAAAGFGRKWQSNLKADAGPRLRSYGGEEHRIRIGFVMQLPFDFANQDRGALKFGTFDFDDEAGPVLGRGDDFPAIGMNQHGVADEGGADAGVPVDGGSGGDLAGGLGRQAIFTGTIANELGLFRQTPFIGNSELLVHAGDTLPRFRNDPAGLRKEHSRGLQ